MQLIRTSFNLRSNMPWDELYQDCIYEWIGSSRDERGKRYYEHLFRKLPRQIDFDEKPSGKFEFAGDKLEYNSFSWKRCDYIGFTFSTKDSISGSVWKMQIAIKRTEEHAFCFVSLDCELGRDKRPPRITRPRIIDLLLTNFQDGDGAIDEIKSQAHILEPSQINRAKNALTGKLHNVLPIVYLSCSERTHAIRPSIVAKSLFGVAHVFCEHDPSLRERLAQEFNGERIPQGGEIGICYAGQPITIFNRYDVVDWVENPETLVQDIFLRILRTNLSLKFSFTWDDLLTAREDYENGLIEQERIEKLNTISEMRAEWLQARQERMDMSCLVEKLMNDLERVTAERDQYKDEHAKYDSLKRKYDNCLDERNTWEGLAVEADEKRKEAEADLREAKEQLHQASTTSNALRQNLNSKNEKTTRYIPLMLPAESEMYPNEYVCQMVRILTLALPNVPTTEKSPKTRTKSFIEDILAANADAVKTFEDYDAKKRELERAARQEGIKSRDGSRAMNPFHMEIIKKGNNHGKIRFINDVQERFLGTEASSGSDSAHGGKNEASDVTKALLW